MNNFAAIENAKCLMVLCEVTAYEKQNREFLYLFMSVRLFRVSTERLLRYVFIAGRHCDMGMVFPKAFYLCTKQRL